MKLETSNFLMVDKNLISNLGLRKATVLCHLISLSDMLGNSFYQQMPRMCKALNLTKRMLEPELAELEALKLISTEIHYKKYYTLNEKLISHLVKNVDPEFQRSVQNVPKSKEKIGTKCSEHLERSVQNVPKIGTKCSVLDTSKLTSNPLKEIKKDPLDTSKAHDTNDTHQAYLLEQQTNEWVFNSLEEDIQSTAKAVSLSSEQAHVVEYPEQESFQEKAASKLFNDEDIQSKLDFDAALDAIAYSRIDIPSQQQAVSLHEQARSVIESVYLAGSFDEVLASLEKQEQDIHPSMEVGWLDTPSIIKKKARKTRKQIKDISHQELDSKWIPFQEFIEEFGITYPCHRDIAKTRLASLELIKKHQEWTPEDIDSVINSIKSHYLGYCSKNGDYAKGPYNYLINELWTVANTKYDPSSSTYSDGTPKRKPGVTRGWN